MDGGEGRAEIGVPFIRTDDKTAGFGDGEVHAGDARFTLQEFLAEVLSRGFGEEWMIAFPLGSPEMFVENLADVLFFLVDGGEDDVAGGFAGELDDPFAEVGVYYFYTPFGEVGVEVAFLGEHRLAFDDFFDVVAGEDGVDDFVVFSGVFGPMGLCAELEGVGLELFEIVRQPGHRVGFDLGGFFAEFFPRGGGVGVAVPLYADEA